MNCKKEVEQIMRAAEIMQFIFRAIIVAVGVVIGLFLVKIFVLMVMFILSTPVFDEQEQKIKTNQDKIDRLRKLRDDKDKEFWI